MITIGYDAAREKLLFSIDKPDLSSIQHLRNCLEMIFPDMFVLYASLGYAELDLCCVDDFNVLERMFFHVPVAIEMSAQLPLILHVAKKIGYSLPQFMGLHPSKRAACLRNSHAAQLIVDEARITLDEFVTLNTDGLDEKLRQEQTPPSNELTQLAKRLGVPVAVLNAFHPSVQSIILEKEKIFVELMGLKTPTRTPYTFFPFGFNYKEKALNIVRFLLLPEKQQLFIFTNSASVMAITRHSSWSDVLLIDKIIAYEIQCDSESLNGLDLDIKDNILDNLEGVKALFHQMTPPETFMAYILNPSLGYYPEWKQSLAKLRLLDKPTQNLLTKHPFEVSALLRSFIAFDEFVRLEQSRQQYLVTYQAQLVHLIGSYSFSLREFFDLDTTTQQYLITYSKEMGHLIGEHRISIDKFFSLDEVTQQYLIKYPEEIGRLMSLSTFPLDRFLDLDEQIRQHLITYSRQMHTIIGANIISLDIFLAMRLDAPIQQYFINYPKEIAKLLGADKISLDHFLTLDTPIQHHLIIHSEAISVLIFSRGFDQFLGIQPIINLEQFLQLDEPTQQYLMNFSEQIYRLFTRTESPLDVFLSFTSSAIDRLINNIEESDKLIHIGKISPRVLLSMESGLFRIVSRNKDNTDKVIALLKSELMDVNDLTCLFELDPDMLECVLLNHQKIIRHLREESLTTNMLLNMNMDNLLSGLETEAYSVNSFTLK